MRINTFSSIHFTTKLISGTMIVLIGSILAVIFVTMNLMDSGLTSLGRDSLENMNKGIYNALKAQHSLLLEKLNGDILILESQLQDMGYFGLDEFQKQHQPIVNQITKEKEDATFPSLTVGSKILNGDTVIVDKIREQIGCAVTIFQVLDGKLLRVSTNVTKTDGQRAVGTYIPADSPVYKTVMKGETYLGRAFVVNTWFETVYKPVTDKNGDIVAVLFVGRPILTDQLRKLLMETKTAGVGYFFVYDDTGQLFIHPTMEGKNLFDVQGVGEHFRGKKDTFIDYVWDGERKISYTQYFEPWDWNLAVGLNSSQMVRGMDRQILIGTVVVGAVTILVSVIIILLLVRSITAPLKVLAGKSLLVAEGDYSITFSHPAGDAIGKLADAFNTMVRNNREMLEEITSVTTSLGMASEELSSTSNQMTDNSNATTKMANTVGEAANNVSSRMHSVSAAMEEASINMNTVATATDQMSATIQEIAHNSERAKSTTANAVVMAQQTSERVNALGQAATEISEVTTTITAISSQTNLLALNATIEAARAGEAGRGFAVVANEIKELALQTARATENIREKIGGIQGETSQTVNDIAEISSIIKDMNDVITTIAAAVEEQSVSTRDIAENVGQASAGITEINSNVATSSTMTHNISEDISKVREASSSMSTDSQSVQTKSTELAELAARLKEQVSRFTL